jgi:hypothetical protein
MVAATAAPKTRRDNRKNGKRFLGAAGTGLRPVSVFFFLRERMLYPYIIFYGDVNSGQRTPWQYFLF